MIKINVKRVCRNLVRNKAYTTINIVGLGMGLGAALLIFLVIHFETNFDNFHKKKDSIYRIVTLAKTSGGVHYDSGVPFPTADALRIDYPQVLVASIFKNSGQISVLGNENKVEKKFEEIGVYFAEPQFFDVFDFGLLEGNKNTILREPNTVLLTQTVAEKYFGNSKNALGKIIRYENRNDLKVTGVLKNMPVNTDFNLDIVISFSTLKNTNFKYNLNEWESTFSYHYCFIVLPKNLKSTSFNINLEAFVKKHKPVEYIKYGLTSIPLSEMHYDPRYGVFDNPTFSKELIKALSLIGIFLIIIACINFINLATAQAVNRSKEIGIRKVLGSDRRQLAFQYLGETFVITVFAVVLAIGLAEVTLPALNKLLNTKLTLTFLTDPVVEIFLLSVIICVTLLSGLYPAILLSGLNPVMALKNKMSSNKLSGISLRRFLVVFQFCISQILVIGTLVIINQLDYFQNHSLGFDKEAIINVPIPNDSISHTRLDIFRSQLLREAGVESVSFSFGSPSDNSSWGTDFKYDNSPKKEDFSANLKWADPQYFKLYNLTFLAGSVYPQSDSVSGYVVNESLIKKLGIVNANEAIGRNINLFDDKTKTARITGVVKDFNITSLRQQIPPVIMASWKDVYQNFDIKLPTGAIIQSLPNIEKLWGKTFPNYVYKYQFLDEKVAKFYSRENQLSILYKLFAGIGIFISSLGLYGLISFMAVQRNREVGIRKTLGASVFSILYLFSREFTFLIILAFFISAPVGWYLMNNWLQNFSYKIHIGFWVFALTLLVSVVISWLTVGYKAVKAALANPVHSLRNE